MTEKLQPQSPEQDKPLTLTLSKKGQEGVFNGLKMSLHAMTNEEAKGSYNDKPEVVEKLDEVRKVTSAIAKNLGREVDPMEALYLGLTDFIPSNQLETWANMQVKDQWDVPVKEKAQYFLAKEARKQGPQKN
jgi:hypothetical protein